MIQLLLDHPWALSESPDRGSILLEFTNLLQTHGLLPVPFVSEQDWAELLQTRRLNYFGRLMRAASSLVRRGDLTLGATPIGAPADLKVEWLAALRQSLSDSDDWRRPQVVIPANRRSLWPQGDELEIEIASCDGQAAPELYERLMVVLENYQLHHFALSDGDPWNLERLHPPSDSRVTHPCCLPKPPELANCALDEIEGKVAACIQDRDTHFYYLPPVGWDCRLVAKHTWRGRGQGFPYQSDRRPHHSGWIDRKDRIWAWDNTERHWDVQMGGSYCRVSHDGRKL